MQNKSNSKSSFELLKATISTSKYLYFTNKEQLEMHYLALSHN